MKLLIPVFTVIIGILILFFVVIPILKSILSVLAKVLAIIIIFMVCILLGQFLLASIFSPLQVLFLALGFTTGFWIKIFLLAVIAIVVITISVKY